jgi:holo-[acyl-carrier protein] synthase
MRIVGLGLDATEVPRIAAMLDDYGDRFRHRVYTAGEIAYCDAKEKRGAAASYAARFAAKEAGMKAIGTGKSAGVLCATSRWCAGGRSPQLEFHGAARRHFERLGATKALITITHTAELAIAHVMLIASSAGAATTVVVSSRRAPAPVSDHEPLAAPSLAGAAIAARRLHWSPPKAR